MIVLKTQDWDIFTPIGNYLLVMSDLQGLILWTLTGTFVTSTRICPAQDTAGSLWIKSKASCLVELTLIWGGWREGGGKEG